MALSKTHDNKRARTRTLIGGSEDDRIAMRIDEAAMAPILDRLTDMYANPVEATVRELVSNGCDATMLLPESERKPVVLRPPTPLNPHFVVEDFGGGMSRETVAKVYSQYGVSTKATDMNSIGAYGLGAKAPLAYTNHFMVETTHGGTTLTFKVGREKEGNFVTILSEEPAGERPSGTKISVPCASGAHFGSFALASRRYATYSMDATVVVEDSNRAVHGFSDHNGRDFSWTQLPVAMKLDDDEQVTGRVWIAEDYWQFILIDVLCGTRLPVGYNLCGWVYPDLAATNSNQRYGHNEHPSFLQAPMRGVMIELKPGVVDFISSRDKITENARMAKLRERTEKFIATDVRDALMERYRAGSKDEAQAFAASLYPRIARNSRQAAHSKQPTFPENFFRTHEGYDPLELFTAHPEPVMAGAMFFEGDQRRYSSATLFWTEAIGSFYGDTNLADFKTYLRQAYSTENYKFSLVRSAGEVALREARHSGKCLVVSGVDGSNFNRFLTHRLTLAKAYPNHTVFFGSGENWEKQVQFLKDFELKATKFTTLSELLQEVKAAKATTPATARGATVTVKNAHRIFERDMKPLELHDCGKSQVMSLKELEELGALILHPNHAARALIASANANPDFLGRPIYLLKSEPVAALLSYPWFTIGDHHPNRSALDKKLRAHCSVEELWDDQVEAMSKSKVLEGFLVNYYYLNIGPFKEYLKAHEPKLWVAIKPLAKLRDSDKLREQRYRGALKDVSQRQFKKFYGKGADEIVAFVDLYSSLQATNKGSKSFGMTEELILSLFKATKWSENDAALKEFALKTYVERVKAVIEAQSKEA